MRPICRGVGWSAAAGTGWFEMGNAEYGPNITTIQVLSFGTNVQRVKLYLRYIASDSFEWVYGRL